jgi:hypothetical protein
MKDKDKLAPLLRSFKNGDTTFDDSIEYILSVFDVSERFNSTSFLIGMVVGGFMGIISMYIAVNFF